MWVNITYMDPMGSYLYEEIQVPTMIYLIALARLVGLWVERLGAFHFTRVKCLHTVPGLAFNTFRCAELDVSWMNCT